MRLCDFSSSKNLAKMCKDCKDYLLNEPDLSKITSRLTLLGVSVLNSDGSYRTLKEILKDINDLEPSSRSFEIVER